MAAKLLAKAKTMLGRGYVADAGECLRKAFVYHPGDPEAARLEIAVRQEAERREERRVALVREMTPFDVPGVNALKLDGRARRLICYYDKSKPVSDRRWSERVSGGHHVKWAGRGEEWRQWALERYKVCEGGAPGTVYMDGQANHPDAPIAFRFLGACLYRIAQVREKAKLSHKETQFLLERLIEIEAAYPVTHWCASDGSRAKTEQGGASVARAAILYDGNKLVVVGGKSPEERAGFAQHSFEAEEDGVHDILSGLEGAVVCNITDCLSGMQAGQRWAARTAFDKEARYRDDMLGEISELEAKQRAVLYVWVHSHVGVLPNELADAYADQMHEEAEREVAIGEPRHTLATMAGVKRDIGSLFYEYFEARLMNKLFGAVHFTLSPWASTWKLTRKSLVKAGLLKYAELDCLQDGRANRLKLLADRRVDDWLDLSVCPEADRQHAQKCTPAKRTWEWAAWYQVNCPCCCVTDVSSLGLAEWEENGERAQTRWHVLTGCSHQHAPAARQAKEKAVAWLERHAGEFATEEAWWALRAMTGRAASLRTSVERLGALRFMLGLPVQPPDERVRKDETLRNSYARSFLRPVSQLLTESVRLAGAVRSRWDAGTLMASLRWRVLDESRLDEPPATRTRANGWLTRRVWLKRRSVREAWLTRQWSCKCLSAWRSYVAACGPTAKSTYIDLWLAGAAPRRMQAALEAAGGVVRATWLDDALDLRGKPVADGVAAYEAWCALRALRRWAVVHQVEGGGARLAVADGSVFDSRTIGHGIVRTREVSRVARERCERERTEVAAWLSGVITKVEREHRRTSGVYVGMLSQLMRNCERATAQAKRRREHAATARTAAVGRKMARTARRRKAAEAARAEAAAAAAALQPVLDGQRADDDDQWAWERVLHVRRGPGGGVQLLVRWRGGHDDSWIKYGDLGTSRAAKCARRAVRAWERRALTPLKREREAAAPSVCPRFTRQAARAANAAAGAEDAGGEAADVLYDFSDEPARLHPVVVLDGVDDMSTELRGDLWRVAPCDVRRDVEAMREVLRRGDPERVEAARRGRSSKRRRP